MLIKGQANSQAPTMNFPILNLRTCTVVTTVSVYKDCLHEANRQMRVCALFAGTLPRKDH